MTVALLLAGYAFAASLALPRLLGRARWPARAPRLAVAVWQASCGSVPLAAALAGLSVTASSLRLTGGVGELLHACALLVRERYATSGSNLIAAFGLLGAAIIVVRLGYATVVALVTAGRRRKAHVEVLTVVGRPVARWGAVVIEHPTPAAYCLPGRRRRIVLTSAAIETLSVAELQAVLCHERAHLRGRHHLVLAGAIAMVRAFPGVRLFPRARDEIVRLLEMLADDAAAKFGDRRIVASALLRVASGTPPAATLAAGGPTATARVQRLLQPARPLTVAERTAGGLLACSLLLVPLLVAAAPALLTLSGPYGHLCPVPGL